MLAVIQAVCVLMVWAQLAKKDCPFVRNSSELVGSSNTGGFKFEGQEYQRRELLVKKKQRFLGYGCFLIFYLEFLQR